MEFRILGPLEVLHEGRVLALGGSKPRALLACLLLHANEVVSRDQLIDSLWGDAAPASAQPSLDSYVARLRGLLGHNRIVRRRPGYLLVVEPAELDLARFEALLHAAREHAADGDLTTAASELRAALSLWRGPALADLVYESFASDEAQRLEERRLVAFEERFDVELAAGGGTELVAELEALARDHPLRERLLGQLMLALYRAGRQAEALAVFQAARVGLADELGLSPGPPLRDLEERILRHDPGLDGRRPLLRRRGRVRGRAVAGAAAVIGIAVAVAFAAARSDEGAPLPAGRDATNRLLAIGTRSGRIVAAAELANAPTAVTVGLGSVWVADPNGDRIGRIELGSGAVSDSIPVGGQPGRLTTGGGAVWAASTLGNEIHRIDPGTDRVTQTIRLRGGNAADIAFGAGAVWVADFTHRTLVALDPRTGSVKRTLPVDIAPAALAVRDETIWVAGYERDVVEGIEPRSGRVVATVAVGHGPSAIAASATAVWVANSLDATVSRIEPATGSVRATLPVARGPSAIAVTGPSVWVASADAGVISQIDTRRNAIARSVPIRGRPEAIAADGDRLWLAAGARAASHRGGTLRLVKAGPFTTTDPALHLDSAYGFVRLAYDTMTTFQPVAGPAGLRLVPDLALALPKPANDDTTYAFRLRAGIRYSDGTPLRATDFRRAIERLFRIRSPGASYYAGVVGAGACERRPRSCRLARGVDTDDAARTVVFRLRAPDPDFLDKLAVLAFSAPVPPGTPDRDVGMEAIPGTGPYRVAAASAREVRLERNPFFREWSSVAQPAGNPDAIVWHFARSHEAAAADVAAGRADWLLGVLSAPVLRSLRLRYPAQLHTAPVPVVEFIPLNTHRPPFDDVRVRRALNYAVDRARIARWYGGAFVATPLCQALAPGLPGYQPFCLYTRRPAADGRWRGPDLGRARRLVAASGTRGERVDVWGPVDEGGTPREIAPYVARVLRSLGYRTRLHSVPYARITQAMRSRIQLSVDGDWQPDYPAPSAYLPQFFGCHGGTSNGYFCDPHLDRRMRKASRLRLTRPARADRLWAAIDRDLARDAAWAPTVSLRAADFVSARLRHYQSSPVGGFIADQVWLR
ncbi:MAG: peptide/nickel transport system substrate-binding protein [Solirubrobacteraceae bacterium]|nr:peptide/nickel transport system substrate-binding protein [Solirubrobacteraceae bacterium]